jgi:hypothetical protein
MTVVIQARRNSTTSEYGLADLFTGTRKQAQRQVNALNAALGWSKYRVRVELDETPLTFMQTSPFGCAPPEECATVCT